MWYADHDWVLDVDRIAELKARADRDGTLVFLCGVAAGDAEAWEHFDVVCALEIDDATIRTRIDLRVDDWFGTRPHELERILGWNVGYAETYRLRRCHRRRDGAAAHRRGRGHRVAE